MTIPGTAERGSFVTMAAHGPGWYPDRQHPHYERWWDGTAWSEHVRERPPAVEPRAETRSSTPNTMEVKAAAPKEGLLHKAWTHAVMTGVGILATAFATGMVGERKQQEIKREGGHALLKSQEIISELLTNQKQSQVELAACRAGRPASSTLAANGPGGDAPPKPAPTPPATPALTLDGSWVTPDRTVVWDIQGERAAIRSVGQLSGFVDGTAHLTLDGTEVKGTLTAATYYGMMQGTATVQAQLQGNYINGTIQDQSGSPQPLVLLRSD
jgi:hypothetical protein